MFRDMVLENPKDQKRQCGFASMNDRPIHPEVRVLGHSEASMCLRQPEHGIAAVLSIHTHGEFPVDATGIEHVLSLQFDDVEMPSQSEGENLHRNWTREKWAKETGRQFTPPCKEDAQAIINFAHTIRTIDGIVLFQCQGGISRSSAAALVCLAAWTGPGWELFCVEELIRVRPGASPNRALVALGDELLELSGRLIGRDGSQEMKRIAANYFGYDLIRICRIVAANN